MFSLNKLSLIILTRCNLKCKLCCEYVPQNKPFPDMTVEEAKQILKEAFKVVDHIQTLHLTGGGEPFLHPKLLELIELAFKYKNQFDRLMLFTNSTISIKPELLNVMIKNKDKLLVQLSQYGINPEREQSIAKLLTDNHINCKIEKYYGDSQAFGGWVDFGKWESFRRTPYELEQTFKACSITRVMNGNWRTRDGKVHWCSRSQRGMELGLISDDSSCYVDLFDNTMNIEEKRAKFQAISTKRYISTCDYCSGDAGTDNNAKRFKAAEQEA